VRGAWLMIESQRVGNSRKQQSPNDFKRLLHLGQGKTAEKGSDGRKRPVQTKACDNVVLYLNVLLSDANSKTCSMNNSKTWDRV
jgi:hypothetical protein